MELIFVYNADSSPLAQIKDLVHKSISPKTYGCRLCSLTFGVFSQKEEWSEFIYSLGIKTEFLHKDEFLKMFPKPKSSEFPSAFLNRGKDLELIISKSAIDKQETLTSLKKLVQDRVEKLRRKVDT